MLTKSQLGIIVAAQLFLARDEFIVHKIPSAIAAVSISLLILTLSLKLHRSSGKRSLCRSRYAYGGFAVSLAIIGVMFACSLVSPGTASATSGINQEMSFEGKIVNSSGQNIADGNYNMEFTIYTGCTNNTGTGCSPAWTEDWIVGSSPVVFTSGTFQANLGSVNPFGTSVPWDTYPLYMSLQIGNQTTCTPAGNFQANCGGDGVMSPYILLTSTPYAMNSNELGGLTYDKFGQLATAQTWTATNTFQPTTNASSLLAKQNSSGSFGQDIFDVQGSSGGANNFIQVTSTATNAGAVNIAGLGSGNGVTVQAANTGSITIGNQTATTANTINIGSTSTAANTDAVNINTEAGSTGAVTIGNSTDTGTITLQTEGISAVMTGSATTPSATVQTSTNSANAFQLKNSNGTPIIQGGTAASADGITNYIADPHFTLGSGNCPLTDWAKVGVPTTCAQNTPATNTYGGTTSLQLVLPTSSTGNGASTSFFTSTPTTATSGAGQFYTVSFYAMQTAGATLLTGANFQVVATGGGNPTGACTINNFSGNSLNAAGFIPVVCNLTFTAAGSITNIAIQDTGTITTADTVYIDDVQLQQVSTNSSSNSAFIDGSLALRGVVTSPLSLQSISNSQTAFQVQTAAGSTVLKVDTIANDVNPVVTAGNNNAGNTQNGIVGQSSSGVGVLGNTGSGYGVQGTSGSGTSGFFQSSSGTNTNTTLSVLGQNGQTTNNLFQVATYTGGNYFGVNANGTTTVQTPTTNQAAAFQVQDAASAPIFTVGTANTLNFLTYPGFEAVTGGTPNGWTSVNSPTLFTQNTTLADVYNGVASLEITTTAAGTQGATTSSFTSSLPTGANNFDISFYAMLGSGSAITGNQFKVTLGGTVATCTGSASITLNTNAMQRISCTIAATATPTSLTITDTNAAISTFYIDAVQLQSGTVATPYDLGTIQLRGLINNPVSIQPTSNSTSALQVANSAGTQVLTVSTSSTSNSQVIVGVGTAGETNPTELVLDSGSSAGDPATVVNGALYYNSNTGQFRCGEHGVWIGCIGGMIGSASASSNAVNTCTNACAAFSNSGTTIPAGYCQPGRVINVFAGGTFSTTTTATTIAFGFYLGTNSSVRTSDTILGAVSPSGAATTSLVATPWTINFTITCYSTTLWDAQGVLTYLNSTTAATANISLQFANSATTEATTALNLYLFPTWGASNASNVMTMDEWIVTGN